MTENTHWSPATPGIQLRSNEVHIWKARLDPDSLNPGYAPACLSTEERVRAARFVFSKDRDHFTATRVILRQLLGRYLGEQPQNVMISILDHGKPSVVAAANLQFNLSHSHGLALFAFCREDEVGVDLEKVRPEVALEGIEDNFFSPHEREELASLPLERRAEGFFLGWTRKESYVKAHGKGLQASLRGFSVSLTPGKPAELDSPDRSKWRLYSLDPGEGFVGALVVEGQEHRLRFLEFDPRNAR